MRTLIAVSLLVGCNAPDERVFAQTEYDLTVTADRERFRESDMKFRGAIGPYAIYEITGAKPALIGPRVRVTRNLGWSMLCGGTKYFTAARSAPRAFMTLRGGRSGETKLCGSNQDPTPPGSCSPAKDVFGNPLPDAGTGDDSDDPGDTSSPTFTPPDGGDTGHDKEGGGDGDVQQIVVALTQPPPPGSTVLVRRVAIKMEREHNGSHVIPDICCQNGSCWLQ